MNIDIANPDDRASAISAIGDMIQSTLDERSIKQHAETILDEYIVRTNHHIWLVGQCAKILRDVVIKYGQDIEMFDTNVEFHDFDKLHDPEILPVYALACHYFYFYNKDVKYKVDEDWLKNEFENNAWTKHHRHNKHHYAEYYGHRDENGFFTVPEKYDVLSLCEMYADWMAMSITQGGTAKDWWEKTYGEGKKWDFNGRDLGVIQSCILTEENAVNQLAYLRQFKDVEPTWVPPMEIETFEDIDPLTTKEVNESIENFFNYSSNETLALKRDDLYIGPIDPMIIDPEKMMKLSEYPELLLALKKWTTMPDFNLAPQLTMLGKIVDDLYKFKNPITCYRGIRTGFDSRSNKKQNLMGVIDNDIEYLRLLKPGFDKAGTTFEYETQEPMSVARSPYIAKIYGNFIIKTEVPADANKLVITPELSYLLQQMEVEYPEYRSVNLSITHEVIVFSGTKLNFEIVSVYGDISSELETMKEHSFEGFGNTEMNGIYFSIFETDQKDTSTEALRAFKNTGVDKQITDLARPCYKPTGQNSWEHIQQVYSQASRICKKIYNRDLTRAEYAAILFHDCSVIDSGKENHNVLSAEKAIKLLSHTPFTDIERDQIYNAIVEHDNQDTSGQWVFSSPASELVAAGDFNPPDAEWIMNKSYTWGITHGLDHAERIENMVSLIKRAYSTNGEMWLHMPNAYKKYFATKINAVKKLFDKITPEEAEKIVMAYRKKHHLSDTDINLPVSSVEMLKFHGDFANTSEKKTIKQLVDKYYDKVGSHGWNHISEVLATAEKLVKRSLTLIEYTAVVCHDLARKEIDEGHPARSVEIAKEILPGTNLFSAEELKEIYKAIGAHGNKHEFASELCELVACADRCFPKITIEDLYERPILWMLEGSDKGKPTEKEYNVSDDLSIATRAVSQIKKWFGDIYDKAVKEDNLYTRTFKNDLKKTQDLANNTRPEQVVPIVKKLRSSFSLESLSTKEYTEADIKSVEDLKQFYKHCSYGLIDFKANKPWKETHNSTTLDDWDKHWKLLSISQLLHFKYGVCYDYAKFSDYFLTKLNVDHVNLFAVTKRDFESGSHLNEDPNHTFTVYKDSNGKWKWLEAAWSANKNNTLEESSSDALIKAIGKLLANASGQPNLIGVVKGFPKDGVGLKEFYHEMLKKCGSFKYEIKPDVSYSKEAINAKVEQNIVDGKVYHASPFKLDKLSGNATKKWSGETGSVFVSPCKGLMPCFCINKDDVLKVAQEQLGGRLVGVNFGYDVWNWSVDKLKTLPSKVTILLNVRGLEPFTGESTGYLYTIDYEKYKDKTHMFNKNMDSDVEFLIEGDVDYIKCEEITVKWECKSSEEEIKRKGEAKVISNEALTSDTIYLIGSTNAGKLAEYSSIFGKMGIKFTNPSKVGGIPDVDENQSTYKGNAEKKAKEIAAAKKMYVLADDSGLSVDALNGEPGVMSGRYAGDSDHNSSANYKLVLKKLEGQKNRKAKYVTALSLADEHGIIKTVIGELHGTIAEEARGSNGFSYDVIFIPDGYNKTVAEMTNDEKNEISHRRKAITLMADYISKHMKTESSNEAISPDIKKKKQLIIDYICSVCDIMDPSKLNSKRYHRLLDSMSDKEFDQWMHYVKEGKWKIHIVAPNLVVTLKNENSLKAADKVKCKLFHRLWMTDDSTGRQYLTDNEYLCLNLPVRRQQQFLDEKMSVPDNDKQIDGLTGQVTGDSKSSAVTNPEIQILAARGLDATLEEFVNVRGGNIAAYSDFKRQAEETGEIKLNSLDPNTRSRVAVVGQVLLRSMMIENNIVE